MNIFTDTKYNLTQVTAITTDTNNGNYIWIAFSQNSNGVCLLKKVSANNLNQVYYTIQVPVTSINAMIVVNGYIFLAVTHPTIFNYAYSVSNPLTVYSYNNKNPYAGPESPIGVTIWNTFVFFLTPGIESGVVATLQSVNFSNTYIGPVYLENSAIFVQNASCVTTDASQNMWVATNTDPSNLVRVWYTGSNWEVEETVLS